MFLFVDETESENFFIVAGLLVPSKDNTDRIFKEFKNSVRNIPVTVQTIIPKDSQIESGLKYVDNICSVLRLHHSCNDINNFYDIINKFTFEV